MSVVAGNDSFVEENERYMDSIFNFGSLKDIHKLQILHTFQACLWESCSSFTHWKCSPHLAGFQQNSINQGNIYEFGDVLETKYCEDLDPLFDSDIIGQGVSIFRYNLKLSNLGVSRYSFHVLFSPY